MRDRAEVLVFGCLEPDLEVFGRAAGPDGPLLHAVASTVRVAHHVMARRPVAVVLGMSLHNLSDLDVIAVIRAVKPDLPVIVIAEEDSLALERSIRQHGIFYYLVHPVEEAEARAVLQAVQRCSRN